MATTELRASALRTVALAQAGRYVRAHAAAMSRPRKDLATALREHSFGAHLTDEDVTGLVELATRLKLGQPDEDYEGALRDAESFALGEGLDLSPLNLCRVLLARWPLRRDDAERLARV